VVLPLYVQVTRVSLLEFLAQTFGQYAIGRLDHYLVILLLDMVDAGSDILMQFLLCYALDVY
jgi:hypothetical protein